MNVTGQLVGGMTNDCDAKQEIARRLTPPTMTERLEQRVVDLRSKLEETEQALAALKDSPEVQRAVDAIAKLGHF